MQPYDKNNDPLAEATPLDEEGLKKLLEKPEVDHVKVFRLKVGDELRIKNELHIVTKTLSGGRAMIKRKP